MKICHQLAGLLLAGLVGLSPAVLAQTPPKVKAAAAATAQRLASNHALVVDLKTNQVLFSQNPDQVAPIASVTKLMTALVVLDAKLPLEQTIDIDISENPAMRGIFSRVRLGSQLTRRDMLQLALMSSENRAATSLAHHYPGGQRAFVAAMNAKARALGMKNTRYAEPTGLSPLNVSTARDLVTLLKATERYPLLGQLSTTPEKTQAFHNPNYVLGFRNTNHLVYNADWSVQLTKTGYTDKAGHCLVMRTVMAGRPVAFVVMDAFGKFTHMADATRVRRWLETGALSPLPGAPKAGRNTVLARQ